MKCTVIRDWWLRGGSYEGSSLLSAKTGKMCCLGFWGLGCGVDPQKLVGSYSPSDLGEQDRNLFGLGFQIEDEFNANRLCMLMMETNDDPDITDEEREEMLIKLFTKAGHEIEFVDQEKRP